MNQFLVYFSYVNSSESKEVSLGIDIGGTNTEFGLVDRKGNLIARDTVHTRSYEHIQPFIDDLKRSTKLLLESCSMDLQLIGVGVGAPNGNYYKGTIEFAPNLKWFGIIPIARLFKEAFNLPVFLTNDANAAAIGEMIYGGARGMSDFILITLGTGLGSGIVCNGKVLYGNDGFAGELGHTIAVREGRMCGCGRKGCLETYASATAIKRTALEMLADGKMYSSLSKIAIEQLGGKSIEKAAREGDTLAMNAFEFTGKMLGQSLADLVALFSPEAIFLSGGLANAGELLFNPTKYHMELNLLQIYKNKVKLLPSTLKEVNAAVIGASALVWNELKD